MLFRMKLCSEKNKKSFCAHQKNERQWCKYICYQTHRIVLPKRNTIQATLIIVNFQVATLTSEKKQTKLVLIRFKIWGKREWSKLILTNIYLCIYLAVLGSSIFIADHEIFGCGIQDLFLWPRLEPRPPALEVWSPGLWTTR